MKTAIALDLAFETIKKIALEFHYLAAAQTSHVDVIALRAAFVKMLFPLHVHEVEFIDQSMTFEKAERAINSNAVDSGIQFAGVTKNLRGVEMLLSCFHHAEDGASLVRQSHATRRQCSLQSPRGFGFRKRHMKLSCNKRNANAQEKQSQMKN